MKCIHSASFLSCISVVQSTCLCFAFEWMKCDPMSFVCFVYLFICCWCWCSCGDWNDSRRRTKRNNSRISFKQNMSFILSNIAHFVFIHLKHCLNNLKTYEYLSGEKNFCVTTYSLKKRKKWALWRHKTSSTIFLEKKIRRSSSALYVKR